MAAEGKSSFKEQRGDTLSFLLKATPEKLLEIAAGTALRADPVVQNFNNSEARDYFHKEDLLRQRIVKEYKRHADFRGMVIRAVAPKQTAGAKPASAGGKPQASAGGKPEADKPEGSKPKGSKPEGGKPKGGGEKKKGS
jgi:hypothetical protein